MPTTRTNNNKIVDDKWLDVDHYVNSHLLDDKQLNESLSKALENSISKGLPDIAVSPAQGQFLRLQCQLLGARNVLEVGTLGGYSTIFLASARPSINVTSVEVDETHAAVARENIAAAGFADRVDVVVGSGLEVLRKLLDQVLSGMREKFDFVFIDADKENNWAYFETSLQMCRPRAQIIVDNVVRDGKIVNVEAAENDSRVRGSQKVIENVGKDSRVHATVLQTVGEKSYDGFLIAVVKDSDEE